MLQAALYMLLSAPVHALSPLPPEAIVKVERSHEGVTVAGSLTAPAGEDHEAAAAGQAWLAVATELTVQGKHEAAYTAATSGVEELGTSYRSGPIRDDTGMKLAAAASQLAAGEVQAAAEVAIEQLGARLTLYETTHGVTIERG